MSTIVGIDLGTTNSIAAFKFAQVELVTADDNAPPDRKLTRSAVAIAQDQLVVGQPAYHQLRADPENVIISIKRLIGRGFTDPEVQEQLTRFGYKITQATHGTADSLAVWLGGREYQPEDIAAEILQQVVRNAQAFQQQQGQQGRLIEAVITIPAYFNDKQRHATRTAALRADLNPRQLLPEPTAAAISYGFTPDRSAEVQTILVYDFGGGTFDASLLTISDNQFIELGKAGDLWLGGDDIDQRIVEYVKAQVAQQEGLGDVDALIAQMPNFQRVRFLADLRIAVEWAKIALSQAPTVRIIPATPLNNEMGMPLLIDVELTREQFESFLSPLVERTLLICHDALQASTLRAEDVDVVLLVGGSAQIPWVQTRVQQEFGADKVKVHPRPMYAVAEGAALVAAGLTENVGTVSRDYYIRLMDGDYKIISRGEVLPFRTAHTFKTVADGQRLLRFAFFNQDDSRQVMEPIGKIWLPLPQPYPQGTEIFVTLELDEQIGNLRVTAVLKHDPSIKVSSLFSRGGTDEQINDEVDQAVLNINELGLTPDVITRISDQVTRIIQSTNRIVDPETGREREDLRKQAEERYEELKNYLSSDRNQALFWVYECDFFVQTYGFAIDPAQQERLRSIAQQLREAIAKNNLSEMQANTVEASREMATLPDEIRRFFTCRDALFSASRIDPLRAQVLNDKQARMLSALQQGDRSEATRIWQELEPEVLFWLQQRPQKATIQTGVGK